MKFHFTKHAKEKLLSIRRAGFLVLQTTVKDTIVEPIKVDQRTDGTSIATSILDKSHVLRVVYRLEDDIIIIITFYPGRRKAYL